MGSTRRWALLSVCLLLIASVSVMVTSRAGAATATKQMNYACAQKSTGKVEYVGSPGACHYQGASPAQKLVIIAGDLRYVCIHPDNSVYLVAAPGSCSLAKNRAVLTLPPAAAPDYCCAAKAGGLLAYASAPDKCAARTQVPVEVAAHVHTPPKLAGAGTAAVTDTAGAAGVPVAPGLTVTSSDDTTAA